MTIEENAEVFAGLPVVDYDPEAGIGDPTGSIYRIRVDYDAEEPIGVLLGQFLDDPAVGRIVGLVIGFWQGDESEADSAPIVEALVAAREKLPDLRSLFLGDITREENEISWIQQSDVTPLPDAYPLLEHLRVRGGTGLVVGRLRHANLRSLVIEAGGLAAEVVRGVAASDLPALEHLELWLGTENYGRTATVEDLAPILAGDAFPALRRLGLRDAQGADAVAAAVARSPLLARLEALDLSLGDLGDEGALALAASPAAAGLKSLDIHHHYASEGAIDALLRLGIEVEAGDRQAEDDWGDGVLHRYIAVSE